MTPSAQVTTPEVERLIAREVTNAKVRGMARSIAIDPTLNEGVLAMMGRASEMRSPLTALLAGIAALPQARRVWETALDEFWSKNRAPTSNIVPEVVIGAGLHSAIYCAMRAEMGMPVPVVLEAEPRAGGIFAASRSGTFFLNSRNRPGGLSIPRSKGALNFLPGGMVQPADVSGEEYQVNSDLAFAIRAIFALTGAKVVTNAKVERIETDNRRQRNSYYGAREYFVTIQLEDGRRLKASRVIVATGIGRPKGFWRTAGERLLKFRNFMASLDSPFPLRGMGRIAVIGAGDSGKTVVEALTGQGPTNHMSVASLDYPSEIVWYGQDNRNRADFEECNRPRYKRLGTLFDSSQNRPQRVQPRRQRVNYVDEGFDCVLVDGEPFDLAIDCTGYDTLSMTGAEPDGLNTVPGELARVYPRPRGDFVDRIFYIGPSAKLPRTQQELLATPDAPTVQAQREAEVAVYRYAGKTAMLAKRLATA